MEEIAPHHSRTSSALMRGHCCIVACVLDSKRGRACPRTPLCPAAGPLSETLLRRFLLGDDERVLKLDYDDGAQLCKYTTDPWIVHSKQVNFTAHKLNPNKAILLKYMKLCG